MKQISFAEFVKNKEVNESIFSGTGILGDLEKQIYKLINVYHDHLVKMSHLQGEKDDSIQHDIINKKDPKEKEILKSLGELFARVHEEEGGSAKPTMLGLGSFEKIARYAKNKLGWHSDMIVDFMDRNSQAVKDLYQIWRPGSWLYNAF